MIKDLDDLKVALDQSVEIYLDGDSKYTGQVQERMHGHMVAEFNVIDGVKHGLEVHYFDSGNASSILYFSGGVVNGSVKHFFESGKIEEDAFFEKGICVKSTTFDEVGGEIEKYEINPSSSDFKWLEYIRRSEP